MRIYMQVTIGCSNTILKWDNEIVLQVERAELISPSLYYVATLYDLDQKRLYNLMLELFLSQEVFQGW